MAVRVFSLYRMEAEEPEGGAGRPREMAQRGRNIVAAVLAQQAKHGSVRCASTSRPILTTVMRTPRCEGWSSRAGWCSTASSATDECLMAEWQ